MRRGNEGRAVVVLLSVLVLLLAGMTASAEGSKEKAKVQPAVSGGDPLAKYAPVEGKQYKIKWISGASLPTEENAEMVLHWEKLFNVDLQIIFFDKYEDQINLMFASGEIPDKFAVNPIQNFYKWINQDLLAAIPEDLIARLSPNMYSEGKRLDPNYFDYGKVNGTIYGIRGFNSTFAYRSVLMWNLKWLKNAGFNAMPSTLDDAERAFYKFRNEDPDKNGKQDTYAFSKEGLYSIFGSFGIFPGGNKFINFDHWVDRNGKLVNSATAPEMRLALEKLAKWYKDGLIDPEWVTGENRGGTSSVSYAFLEQRIGMTSMGTYYHWIPSQVKGGYQGMNYTEALKIFGDETRNVFGYGGPLAVAGYKSALPNNAELGPPLALGKPLEKEPDKLGKILTMIEYFGKKDNYLTAFRGIEGKHWQYVDGIATSLGKFVDVSEQSRIGGHNTMIGFATPEIQLGVLFPGFSDFAVKNGLDKNILKNQLKMPLASEGKYRAELNKLRDDMIFQIVTGKKPLGYFDEYVGKYNSSGGNDLVAEANAWYQGVSRK